MRHSARLFAFFGAAGIGRLLAIALFVPLAMTGCGLFGPGRVINQEDGRVAIVFRNGTDSVVQVIVAGNSGGVSAGVWSVSVAPQSWESLIVDCGIDQLVLLGTAVVKSLDDTSTTLVTYDGDPIDLGGDTACGSIVDIRVTPARPASDRTPVAMQVAVQPRDPADASVDLGNSGFVVLEVEAPLGVVAEVNVSWIDAAARIYETKLALTGRESRFGFLVRCPVTLFSLGRLTEPEAPLGTVHEQDVYDSPTTLRDVPCGSVVAVRVRRAASGSATRYAIEAVLDESSAAAMKATLTGVNGLLARNGEPLLPSNSLQLLPPPGNAEFEP